MPELPEVETIKNILKDVVVGKKIKDITILRDKNILNEPAFFIDSLLGKTFTDVTRKGKFLIFHLTSSLAIISHLRMEGKYFEGREGEKPDKHDILIYHFDDGTTLRYNDVRKFGIIKLSNEKDYLNEKPLSDLGKEPFDISKEELHARLLTKKCMIKEALLDQKIIAGLGNIYDDEVLYACKINPKTPAHKITLEQCQNIIDESIRILDMAIENGGSTIKSYHPKDGVSGLMQNNLLAYGNGNKPCQRCHFPMRKIFIGGRGTSFCPICQKENGKPLIIGVTGPIASGKSSVARYLSNKGFEAISADDIVNEIYQNEIYLAKLEPLLNGLVSDGVVNRTKLMDKLLGDEDYRKSYEQIIHGFVYDEIENRVKMTNSDKIVLDVPLLVPSPIEEMCDLIITVLADENIRANRIAARGKDPAKALKLNKSFQKSKSISHSGLILDGNGDNDALFAQLDKTGLF